MNARSVLLKLYFNIETAYYEFLDALDNYLPIYKTLVNPLENRGYPSLPIYLALFVLILATLFFASFGAQAQSVSLSFTVQNNEGNFLPARVEVFSVGEKVADGVAEFGRVTFSGVPKTPLSVKVSASGYETKTLSLDYFPLEAVSISLLPNQQTLSDQRRREVAISQANAAFEQAGIDVPSFGEMFEGVEPPSFLGGSRS